uniref:Agenet domain-containing protein n=1 Tax=Noccaea caerulescens TaxID=107243 RepID=A0A1J3F6W0_NOCCA
MTQTNLPFQVGNTVEVRSFESGFRGAWFRCKIKKIFKKGRALYYDLEYLDFPGEGLHTTKVYQKLEGENEKYLMIRPLFPRQCHENEVLVKEDGLEEALVVHDLWKVGDLVDWWKDHCYWCGTVLEVKEDESVKIELLPQPYGEGSSYEALCKDLRPSLEWSPEDGWIVPFSKDEERRQCAKLIKLSDEVKGGKTREEEKQRSTEILKGGNGDLALNIMESESIEAAVMDLEELIVRIEWLKGLLPLDVPNSSQHSSWRYEDYLPSS